MGCHLTVVKLGSGSLTDFYYSFNLPSYFLPYLHPHVQRFLVSPISNLCVCVCICVCVCERETESLREKNKGGLQEKLVCLLVFSHIEGFPHSSVGKESACNAGDLSSIPGLGRSPGEGNGNPLQYSCLENLTDRGAWQATVDGVSIVEHDLATKPPSLPTSL